MATEFTPRREPCTTCGRDVLHVVITREGLGPHYGQVAARYDQHADHAVFGDKVDDACTWPS